MHKDTQILSEIILKETFVVLSTGIFFKHKPFASQTGPTLHTSGATCSVEHQPSACLLWNIHKAVPMERLWKTPVSVSCFFAATVTQQCQCGVLAKSTNVICEIRGFSIVDVYAGISFGDQGIKAAFAKQQSPNQLIRSH